MLADVLAEYTKGEIDTWKRIDPGYSPEFYKKFYNDLTSAVRISLDPAATVAAYLAAVSSPQSILAALSLVRLPAPTLWIEWPEMERFAFRRKFPDTFTLKENSTVPPRIGILYTETPSGFDIRLGYGDAKARIISFVSMNFDRDSVQIRYDPEEYRKTASPQDIAYLGGSANLPAAMALQGHFKPRDDQDVIEHFEQMVSLGFMTFEDARQMVLDHRGDIGSEVLYSIALILLLNSRNALVQKDADLEKLNRARKKSGKPPLLSYRDTKLVLGRAARQRAEKACSIASGSVVSHWQNGHFKVRRTGVFWWSGHIRANADKGSKPARYAATADEGTKIGFEAGSRPAA